MDQILSRLVPAPEDRSNHSPQPCQKTTDSAAPLKKGRSRLGGSYAVVHAATRLMNVVPHERIHQHKLCGSDDEETILY